MTIPDAVAPMGGGGTSDAAGSLGPPTQPPATESPAAAAAAATGQLLRKAPTRWFYKYLRKIGINICS